MRYIVAVITLYIVVMACIALVKTKGVLTNHQMENLIRANTMTPRIQCDLRGSQYVGIIINRVGSEVTFEDGSMLRMAQYTPELTDYITLVPYADDYWLGFSYYGYVYDPVDNIRYETKMGFGESISLTKLSGGKNKSESIKQIIRDNGLGLTNR